MVLTLKGKETHCAICQPRDHEEIHDSLFLEVPEEETGEEYQGPWEGRVEAWTDWYFEEGRGRCRRGSPMPVATLYLLESQHGYKGMSSRLGFRKTEFWALPCGLLPPPVLPDTGQVTGYTLNPWDLLCTHPSCHYEIQRRKSPAVG